MFFHMVLRDSTPILQIHVDIKQCSPLLINVKLTAVIGFRLKFVRILTPFQSTWTDVH